MTRSLARRLLYTANVISALLVLLQLVLVALRGGFSHRYGWAYVALMFCLSVALRLCWRLSNRRPGRAVAWGAWASLLAIGGMVVLAGALPGRDLPVIVVCLLPGLKALKLASCRAHKAYTIGLVIVALAAAVGALW